MCLNALRFRVGVKTGLAMGRIIYNRHKGTNSNCQRGRSVRFARRAERLGSSVYDHADGVIILSVGSAYPPTLPDLSREAAEAAGDHTAQSMQYGPLMGLDDLRDAIAAYVAEDGVSCTRDNVLVTNGAKHATDLAARVFLDPGDRMIVTTPPT